MPTEFEAQKEKQKAEAQKQTEPIIPRGLKK